MSCVYTGYFPALLSTVRNMPMAGEAGVFEKLAQTGVPVAAVFGQDDVTIPIAHGEELKSVIPDAQVDVLDGADHGLVYKKYDKVGPMFVSFFQD